MIPCIDYLGGAQFPKAILAAHKRGYGAGFFAETFGNAFPTIAGLLKTGKCPVVRIQLIWSDTHSFGSGDIPKIKSLSAKCEAIQKQFPNVKVYISPFCEHNVAYPDKYLDIAQSAAPSCTILNTPWRGGMSKKYGNEVHAEHGKIVPNLVSFSYDGVNAVDSNVEEYKKKFSCCELFFMWHPRCNGKWSMKDTTPRPQRDGWASKELIESLNSTHTFLLLI